MINLEAKELAKKLEPEFDERIEIMAKAEAFITLKDHKDRFEMTSHAA